jgi:ketosteroid isomerase-like protein
MSRLLILISLLGFNRPGAPHGPASCANNIAALDREYQAAVANKDTATIDRMLPDDFVLITSKGEVDTKAELLREARDPNIIYTRQDDSLQTVRVWGSTAVITALLTAEGTENGQAFRYRVWFSDTYVCTSSGWRYVLGQAGGRV